MPKRGTALTVGQFAEFGGAVLKALPRDIEPDVALNWARDGAALEKVLREALVPDTENEDQLDTAILTVDVNYARTVEEMVEAGRYGWNNSDISSRNFPVNRRELGNLKVHLLHFNRFISSDGAIKELDKMGFRPAELPELLALGAQHPDEQRKYPIVALGSAWRSPDGGRGVPCLDGGGSGRDLSLGWFGREWGEGYRFAAVRK